MQFSFRGKSGKDHQITLESPRLARIVRRCQQLPGQELFRYIADDGSPQTLLSGDVNAYLKEITNEPFTAKDFRTWYGTVLAVRALREFPDFKSAAEGKRNVTASIKAVAEMLGNTPAVCRNSYIHPAVPEAYLSRNPVLFSNPEEPAELKPEERTTLQLLREASLIDQVLPPKRSRRKSKVLAACQSAG